MGRRAAIAAASRGVAPSDLGVAWAAAGYGRLVARRMRVARVLMPVLVVVVTLAVTVPLIVAGASPQVMDATMVALVVGFVAGVIGLQLWARRYQRLYSSGLIGLEAARLGAPAGPAGHAMWRAPTAGSEFTVPYRALAPVIQPVPVPVTDPFAAGVQEIPARRGRIVVGLVAMLAIALVLWLFVAHAWQSGLRQPFFALTMTVFAVVYTVLLIFLLYVVTPALRRPVIARFTPEGWELPQLRMRGPWAWVRAIRVGPLAVRGSAGALQLAAARTVALIVDEPERYIAHLSAPRRALLRSSIRKYGSPIVIVATPQRSLSFVDLVRLLQRYTPAPVDWA